MPERHAISSSRSGSSGSDGSRTASRSGGSGRPRRGAPRREERRSRRDEPRRGAREDRGGRRDERESRRGAGDGPRAVDARRDEGAAPAMAHSASHRGPGSEVAAMALDPAELARLAAEVEAAPTFPEGEPGPGELGERVASGAGPRAGAAAAAPTGTEHDAWAAAAAAMGLPRGGPPRAAAPPGARAAGPSGGRAVDTGSRFAELRTSVISYR